MLALHYQKWDAVRVRDTTDIRTASNEIIVICNIKPDRRGGGGG